MDHQEHQVLPELVVVQDQVVRQDLQDLVEHQVQVVQVVHQELPVQVDLVDLPVHPVHPVQVDLVDLRVHPVQVVLQDHRVQADLVGRQVLQDQVDHRDQVVLLVKEELFGLKVLVLQVLLRVPKMVICT